MYQIFFRAITVRFVITGNVRRVKTVLRNQIVVAPASQHKILLSTTDLCRTKLRTVKSINKIHYPKFVQYNLNEFSV